MNKKFNLNKFLTFLENDFYKSLKVMIPVMAMLLMEHLGAAILSINSFNRINNPLGFDYRLSMA